MNDPILIGLTGKRGSGKNTVAEFIAEWAEDKGGAELQGFADRLKLSFARIFKPDCTLEQALKFADCFKTNGTLEADALLTEDIFYVFGGASPITGRQALQNYGTEAHRDVFGDNFWTDMLLPLQGDRPWKPVKYHIVYDMRFSNEAERVRELGGFNIEVQRPELEGQEDSHASEAGLPEKMIDLKIVNSGTLDQLRHDVTILMDNFNDLFYNKRIRQTVGSQS